MTVTPLSAPKLVVSRETVRVNVPLAPLWELLSNTQRVNHTLGLPAANFSLTPDGGSMNAAANFMGVRFQWIERPFEWVQYRWYRVQRDFEGPLRRLVVQVAFEALSPETTEVTITVESEPANPIGHIAARTVLGRSTLQQYRAMILDWERRYRQQEMLTFPVVSSPEINRPLLDKAAADLRREPRLNLPDALVERLVAHLSSAPDDEVVRMRPLALADAWGFDRMETVRLFLYATRKGLVDLHWEVLCPNCRVSKASYERLSDLEGVAHCETCRIRFDADFDQYVELRFSSHPAIRLATAYTYCVGGPFTTRHIVVQQRIPAQSRKEFSAGLPAGEYRLRCGGTNARGLLHLSSEAEASAAELTLNEDGVERVELAFSDGQDFTLTVQNDTDHEQLFIIERTAWDAQVLSAARVTTLQEFRRLFSSEVLSVGMGVEVRTLNVMFTDLKNSTKLYIEEGDSRAYNQVREQFAVLVDTITEHRGALVKTIGDAVMAVFYEGTDAVNAALAMQQGISALNARYPDRLPLRLKVGIHCGPCIVITANESLDYFGTTVNTAAFAGALGQGDDIVLTADAAAQAGVEPLLAPHSIASFQGTLKGMAEPMEFYRVTPAPPRVEPQAETPPESVPLAANGSLDEHIGAL